MNASPELAETTQCLCLASRRAARMITRSFDRELRAHGLRSTQFTLLATLSLAGAQPMGALAELIGADRTTLTRNVALAEAKDLVRVGPDAKDARARVVTITETGDEALRAALPTWARVQGEIAGTVGAATVRSLRRLSGASAR